MWCVTPRLFSSALLRLVGPVVLFGTFGRTLPAAASPLKESVVRVEDYKPACFPIALSHHLEALPTDALVWSSGLGLPAEFAPAGLLPTMPNTLFGTTGAGCLLPHVQLVAYVSLIQARLLRTTLCPNAL